MDFSDRLLAQALIDQPPPDPSLGQRAMNFIGSIPSGLMNYLRWNLIGSPGGTPPELAMGAINSAADAGRMMTTPALQPPAGSSTDDTGMISQGRADPQAWQQFVADQQARNNLAPRTALGMLGMGANFAERGAAGAAGGKLYQAGKGELSPALMDELRAKLGPDFAKQYEPGATIATPAQSASMSQPLAPKPDRMNRALDIINSYVKGEGTYPEIAAMKGVSKGAVAGIITRANNGFYGDQIATNMRLVKPSTFEQMREYGNPGAKPSTIADQVIELRAQGKVPSEIAPLLGVSERTIYRHFAKQNSQ